MSILLITGISGVGKTKLLSQCSKQPIGARMYLVDPLSDRINQWQWPDPEEYELISFDHISSLHSARSQIEQAIEWCHENNKPLWLVEQTREDILATGVDLGEDVFEITLMGKEYQGSIAITYRGNKQLLSPEETLLFLNQKLAFTESSHASR